MSSARRTASCLGALGLLLGCVPEHGVAPDRSEPPSAGRAEHATVEPVVHDDTMVWIEGGVDDGGAVQPFWMDRMEVGLDAYRRCIRAEACREPDVRAREQSPHPDGPVSVSAPLAQQYCAWAGKRLPTVREWLWAATGRGERREFPWGDALPTFRHVFAADGDHDLGVIADPSTPEGPHVVRAVLEGESVKMWVQLPTARGSRPLGASRDGVLDLLGNVQEAVRLPSGEVSYIGGAYATALPSQAEIAALQWPEEKIHGLMLERMMMPIPVESLDASSAYLRHHRGFGVRCVADAGDERSRSTGPASRYGRARVLSVAGTRRAGEASELCSAANADGLSWALPTAAELGALPSDVLEAGRFWVADGAVWTPEGTHAPESSRVTALALCVIASK